jgi:hypothetical protein
MNFTKNTSNKFLKKVLKTKSFFKTTKTINFISPNIHKVISTIKSWDRKIEFFLSPKIIISSKQINKNILRNIFLSTVNDKRIWFEIEKMINANVIGISDYYIYREIIPSNNSLSKFLLNIYFSRLDTYIKKLCNFSNFNKLLFLKPYFIRTFYKRNIKIMKNYLPVRMRSFLMHSFNLKNLQALKGKRFSFLYKKDSYNLDFLFFCKEIYYVRYFEHIALGIVGSKSFSKFTNHKIKGFLRSNLHFDFFINSFQYAFSEKIFFLGFHIQLLKSNFKKHNFIFNLKIAKKYFSRIHSRLILWKKKISSLMLDRFSFELFGQVLSVLQNNNLNFSSLKDRKVWLFLFQFESVRCFQVGKLINSSDKLNLISDEILLDLKFPTITSYKNFSFNFYLKKMRLLIKNVIDYFPFFLSKSVLPFDISFSNFFFEYKKKFNFFNDTFYLLDLNQNRLKFYAENPFNNYLYNGIKKEDYTYKSNFVIKKILFLSNKNKKQTKTYFLISCPVSYILSKFENLGFINLRKKRPISNVKFLTYEDREIIRTFGAFSYSLLNWFRCVDNFSKVKFLIEVIRQSCILTLCRKHNKRKTWAYGVYTPNLILNYYIYENKSFFPTKKLVSTMKKSFLYNQIDFLFFETFFEIY